MLYPKISIKSLTIYVLLTGGAILMLLPLLWMFSTSLRPASESYTLPPAWLPTKFHTANYASVFESSVPMLQLFWNTFKVTALVTVGQLLALRHGRLRLCETSVSRS